MKTPETPLSLIQDSATRQLHWLLSWIQSLVSPGEQAACRRLLMEWRISYYHRKGLRLIRRQSLSRPKKINLGSGPVRKEGFLNIDLFPGGDLTLDLRRGLPFDPACCDTIFSEHFLEHLDYPEPVSGLLRDCLRILRPGGFLLLSVPDTEWPLVDYCQGLDAAYFQACRDNASWHPPYCTTRLEHINYHFRQRGEHLFAYDEETATKLLTEAGFFTVTRRDYQAGLDSEHRRIGSLFLRAQKSRASLKL